MASRFPLLAAALLSLAPRPSVEAQSAAPPTTVPGLRESVEILAAAGALPPDSAAALRLIADRPGLRAALPLLIQRDILQANLGARGLAVRVDGKDDEWAAVPETVTDPTGDFFQGRADMDVIRAASFLDDGGRLDLLLRTQAPPAADPYYDFLIDVPGRGADWDYQLILWTDSAKDYAALNDLNAGTPVAEAGIESARDAVLEVRLPLSSMALASGARGLRILARGFDREATTVDASPVLQPLLSLENDCLALLLELLARDPSAAEDDACAALALANGWLYSVADKDTRGRIRTDMADHLALYRRIVAWQAEAGLPYRLDRVPLLAKVVWADRAGSAFWLIQEAMRLRGAPGLLTLPVYEEFVDKPSDLAWLHGIVRREGLGAPTLRAAAAALEDFVHRNRVYRSSMENLEDFNRRGIFSDADLAAARAEFAAGGYERTWFGRTRRWDEFRWLGWQARSFRGDGRFLGDCGDTTVVQMGFYRALGVAPLSLQWAHPEGIAAWTHNFPGYYDPVFHRWYSVQKPFFFGFGGVSLEHVPVFFHYVKPHWHPWLAREDYQTKVTGKRTAIFSSHYQGEATDSERLKVFLTRGMEEDLFTDVFLTSRTQEPGLFFTDRSAPALLADRDGDGLEDGLEAALGSDPGSADSDGDGFADLWEAERGYRPADALNHGPEEVPAADGLMRAAERTGCVAAVDQAGDAALPGPGDARRLLCRAEGDALYAAVEFDGPVPAATRASHGLLITPNRADADEYWVWFQDGTAGASRRRRGAEAWAAMPPRPGLSMASLAVAEFSIPLSYAGGASSVFVRYFLDVRAEASQALSRTDWTPSVRVSLGPSDTATALAASAAAAPAVRDARGDARRTPCPYDIRSLRCADDGNLLSCCVEYWQDAAALPFGTCSFSVMEKESGKSWWIQWYDPGGISVWSAVGEAPLEPTAFRRDGYDILPSENGYTFLIPRSQFSPGSTLYLRFIAGCTAADGTAVQSDEVGRVRLPPGQDAAAALFTPLRAADPGASVTDPAGDGKALTPRFDVRSMRARVSDGFLAVYVEYHEAPWDAGFGFHSIHLRSPGDGMNRWIQWWAPGGFGVWGWKDGMESSPLAVDRSAFDCLPFGDSMGFLLPLGTLFSDRQDGTPESLEVTCYAGGTDAGGKGDPNGDMTEALPVRTR